MILRNARFYLFVLFLFSFFNCHADSSPKEITWISLKGFLGKEELTRAKSTVEGLKNNANQTLILELHSSSADLSQVIDLAKSIYELKKLNLLKVITYIDDSAIGPVAILPFLSDELYISLFASWGGIPNGSEGTLPTNILRSQVRSLIDNSNPKAADLFLLADAMTDPAVQIVSEGKQWKIAQNQKDLSLPLISSTGQTLVVNHNQLQELGLVTAVLPLEKFKERFYLSKMESSKGSMKESVTIEPVTESSLEESLKAHIHFHAQGTNEVGHILINDREGGINQSTWLYVKQALDNYKISKPCFIILELNTPGGEVFAAQKISDALKEMDTQLHIPVVAVINNWAISAGAMLAYSCRYITVVKDASMGAAEPVFAGQTGKMETASEKVNSAIRTDFANRAAFFGRNPLIAEAMVDKDLILVWRHDKVMKLDNESQIRLTGTEPDVVISPKGKLLTLTADQLMEYHVANILLPPEKVNPITPEEQSKGEWPASKMLLFQAPFFKDIPNAVVKSYRMDWKTEFFVFLASPLVSSLLMMGLMIGAYMEMNHPGASLPGAVAAICLFLIVLSSFSLEIANWLELILLLTGIILILVELFILPTFGLLGFVGIGLFIFGLFGMMLPGIGSVSFDYDSKTVNAAGEYFFYRLAWLSGAFILSLAIIGVLAQYVLPAFTGFNPFILQGNEQDASRGYFAGEAPSSLPKAGEKGIVLATLRPAGKVMIHNQIYDAISSGQFIEKGESIVVAGLEGSVIIVREVT